MSQQYCRVMKILNLHPEEKLSVTAEIFIFIKITCNPLHIDVVIN